MSLLDEYQPYLPFLFSSVMVQLYLIYTLSNKLAFISVITYLLLGWSFSFAKKKVIHKTKQTGNNK